MRNGVVDAGVGFIRVDIVVDKRSILTHTLLVLQAVATGQHLKKRKNKTPFLPPSRGVHDRDGMGTDRRRVRGNVDGRC